MKTVSNKPPYACFKVNVLSNPAAQAWNETIQAKSLIDRALNPAIRAKSSAPEAFCSNEGEILVKCRAFFLTVQAEITMAEVFSSSDHAFCLNGQAFCGNDKAFCLDNLAPSEIGPLLEFQPYSRFGFKRSTHRRRSQPMPYHPIAPAGDANGAVRKFTSTLRQRMLRVCWMFYASGRLVHSFLKVPFIPPNTLRYSERAICPDGSDS